MILRSLSLFAVLLQAVSTDTTVWITYHRNSSTLTFVLPRNIVITDEINIPLSCKWGQYSCYSDCNNTNIENIIGNFSEDRFEDCIDVIYNGSNSYQFTLWSSHCEIVKCLEDPFTDLLMKVAYQEMEIPNKLKRVLIMKDMCKVLFKKVKIKKAYIAMERSLIRQLIEISYDGEKMIYNLTDLAIKVVTINLTKLNTPYKTEDYIHIEAPLLSYKDLRYTPNISIPGEILQKIPEEKRKVAVVLYESPDIFLFEEERPQSKLIRVELAIETHVENLIKPLQMQFQLFDLPVDPMFHSFECQFYDEWGNDSWSNEGCKTNHHLNNTVSCSCDHMTPFAVLLITTDTIDPKTWKILSIISYIGSGVSAFFTAISILTYFTIRIPSHDHSSTIHVSLSGALFLLNVTFLLNEWLSNMRMVPLCLFIAVLMHYSLLCSFTWMVIEALHLYLLIIKVFNIYIRYYIAKMSAIGWGVPAVIVGVAFAVKSEPGQFYGLKHINMENSTGSLCWITEPMYFYGVNLTYFAIVFLFNNGILLTVSFRIYKLKRDGKKSGMTPPWKKTCTVLGLTCLLGTTWGMAFLNFGALSLPMLYLFCIFNSLQGFFLFLWMYGTSRKDKSEKVHSKSTSAVQFSQNLHTTPPLPNIVNSKHD